MLEDRSLNLKGSRSVEKIHLETSCIDDNTAERIVARFHRLKSFHSQNAVFEWYRYVNTPKRTISALRQYTSETLESLTYVHAGLARPPDPSDGDEQEKRTLLSTT